MIQRKLTFDNIRKEFGNLKTKQVQGFEAFFNEFEVRKIKDIRYLAYILATVWHETAKTMQPIEEFGKGKDRDYGKRLRYNRKLYTNTLNIFYGRGHTQNTWIDIYEKLSEASPYGLNFVRFPDLLLQMEHSVWVTYHSMLTGLYTGKKLSQYFSLTENNPVGARKIINGKDCDMLIAGYYTKFLKSLKNE